MVTDGQVTNQSVAGCRGVLMKIRQKCPIPHKRSKVGRAPKLLVHQRQGLSSLVGGDGDQRSSGNQQPPGLLGEGCGGVAY